MDHQTEPRGPHSKTETGLVARLRREPFLVLFAIVLCLATWLRFDGLIRREPWIDESCTFYAQHHLFNWPADGPEPWKELAHFPYLFLLRLWTVLFGESAQGLRSLSAGCGVIGVGLIGAVAWRLGGRRVGLICVLIAACHALHIHYSQEARVYTLWMCAMTATSYFLYESARTLRAGWWIGYAVLTLLAVLSHYYTLLWIPASFTVLLVADDRRRCFRQWLATHIALTFVLTPVVWLLVAPLSHGGPKPWLRDTWLNYPPALAMFRSLWAMLPSGGYPSYLGALTVAAEQWGGDHGFLWTYLIVWGPAVAVGVMLLCLFTKGKSPCPSAVGEMGQGALEGEPESILEDDPRTGTLPGWEREFARNALHKAQEGRSPFHRLLLAWLFSQSMIFLLTAMLFSWCVEPFYIVGRYDLAAWPTLTVAIGLMIDEFARRLSNRQFVRTTARVGLTTLLAGCGLITVLGSRTVPAGHDLGDRARRMAVLVGNDDLVISMGMYRWFMTYEWQRIGFAPRVLSFPPAQDRRLCWDNPEAELADPAAIVADVERVVRDVNRALAAGTRVWLLAQGEPASSRWEVDRQFFAGLRRHGFDVRLKDEWLGLAELLRFPSDMPEQQPP